MSKTQTQQDDSFPSLPLQQIRTIEKSQTLLLNEQSRNMEQDGQQVYKFGFGQSPFSPPQKVINALKEEANQHYYSKVQGIDALREKVAEFHSALGNTLYTANDVLIAPGSKALLFSVMACFSKAEVFIPAPAWVSYEPQATLLGHKVSRIDTSHANRWRVTPALLAETLANRQDKGLQALLVLNYPGNPDGLSYSVEELEQISDILREHNVLVISDEIYGLLNHKGEHRTLADFYPEGTVVTTGLSKWCGAGGWRLGVALLPPTIDPSFKEAMLGIASETYSCASTPVQLAAMIAYDKDDQDIQNFIAHQRRILSLLGNAAYQRLSDAGVNVHAPEGGFYLYTDFTPFRQRLSDKGIQTSEELCKCLLIETGVALLPSSAFGISSDYLSARLAYVEFDGNAALAASEKIGLDIPLTESFITEHCPLVLEGIDKLTNWLNG